MKETHIKSYSAAELKANHGRSRTEKLVFVQPKQSIHLRLEQEIIDFF